MIPRLAPRMGRVKFSATVELFARVAQLRASGIDVVNLTAGEPDFPTPGAVREAAVKAIEEGYTRYTPNRGSPELIEAIRAKFWSDNRLAFEPGQIIVTTGAKQSIFNAVHAICDEGDEVVLVAPYWVSYPDIVRLAGAKPVVIRTSPRNGYIPDPVQFRDALSPRTKAIILNTPSNPTGAVYDRRTLEGLARIATDAGVYIISDEIYEKVIFDGRAHVSVGALGEARGGVITVNGLSKGYAMTGWRIGYMGGPPDVIDAAATIQSQSTSCANAIAQRAAVAALALPTDELKAMGTAYQARRDRVVAALSGIDGVEPFTPGGALYIYADIRGVLQKGDAGQSTCDALARYLLEEHHVAVVPGSAFGDDGTIRIAISSSREELDRGMERITRGINVFTTH